MLFISFLLGELFLLLKTYVFKKCIQKRYRYPSPYSLSFASYINHHHLFQVLCYTGGYFKEIISTQMSL